MIMMKLKPLILVFFLMFLVLHYLTNQTNSDSYLGGHTGITTPLRPPPPRKTYCSRSSSSPPPPKYMYVTGVPGELYRTEPDDQWGYNSSVNRNLVYLVLKLELNFRDQRNKLTQEVSSAFSGKLNILVSSLLMLKTFVSKHALHGYFHSLRSEFCQKGIKVTVVCPGPIETWNGTGTSTSEDSKSPEKRVSSERCAELTIIAASHNLKEAWISYQPVLLVMYLVQYMPSLGFWLMDKVLCSSINFLQKLPV
ncbi:putative short-chain dehydrogenase/reductase SDR, NAD(P)-binding domain superfamily [Arabidopsis thaliana]